MAFVGNVSLEATSEIDGLSEWAATAVQGLRAAGADILTTDLLKKVPSPKPVVVFVLGGPGAGKGTQCELIVNKYGYTHISAGDCLRAERASGSKFAELINDCIRDGKIVPVEITVKLLLKAMEESGKSKFLIDGFPRNLENLDGWIRVVGLSAVVKLVLFFDCGADVMEKRLLKRGETSGRTDDNIESIRKRFATYYRESMPIIHTFEGVGKVRQISADRPKEEVWADVQRIIDNLEAETAPSYYSAVIQASLADSAAVATFDQEAVKLQADLYAKFGARVSISTSVFSSSSPPAIPSPPVTCCGSEKAPASSGCGCGPDCKCASCSTGGSSTTPVLITALLAVTGIAAYLFATRK